MPTLVIVGAQWGDEAKGKLVDYFGGQSDLTVRYAGGNNAGHTVIVGDKEFKFQLIPSGILHPRTISVLAAGMVVCPKGLLDELDRTIAQQPEIGELQVSTCAHVVFPYHNMLDKLEEQARGANPIGTTSRGIGPAYQDKVARIGIRMGDFVNPDRFKLRLAEVLEVKNKLLSLFGESPLSYQALYDEYSRYADRIRPMVKETDQTIQNAFRAAKRILLEGAQGTLLDLDHGTYPYVTSSHPIAGGATLGTGLGPRNINNVIGVCKAYTTRVGSGPFPTELTDETGEWIRQKGKEFGTVTGRSRRCGWLDCVLLRQSSMINSASGWALSRLDILGELDEIMVATDYEVDGRRIGYFPSDLALLAKCKPVLTPLKGWKADLRGCRHWDDLPGAAQDYVRFLERETDTPVAVISIGPSREETITIRPDLIWS